MAKKLCSFTVLLLVCSMAMAQQQILLLTESFENATNSIVIDSPGVGTNTGGNDWIVNNSYNGQPLYPNTPPQDSVVSGTINGAPNSQYLHIHDKAAVTSNGISNSNWNSSTASDRFCYIGSPFCTLGMSNVIFTFFWISQGDNTAYGEVYYRIDGGPWIKTGQTKYNNQSKWKYEVIQDPAFNNVQNLQMGFRWVNPASGVTTNNSFSIDDIIAVGTYDNVNNPVKVSVNLISPTTVCQDNYITIGYHLSAPLCDGTYRIQMSNATGSFATPIDGGVFNVFAPDTQGFIGFQVPDNVSGNCFRIRINRVSPQPTITGDTSICFAIVDCPETIITNNAPVMSDNDTTCILSVIDVKFNSFGVFTSGNNYIAELSDSTGNFANPFFLGNNNTTDAYPGPPGNVSGLIPATVPPGCGYYIRIRSTRPAITGSIIGPFCLAQCDELTNNHTDIHFCVSSGPFPACSTIVIHPNQWTPDASYDTCNSWTIELHDMNTFALLNSGGLGVYHDSIGGNFTLCVPSTADSLPVAPGSYYMRMVSNCSNQPWNQTGSVIRVIIGAPDLTPPIIESIDTVYCNLGLVDFTVNPFKHPPSDYEWSSSGLNNGNAFIWPYNPLIVDFTGAQVNDYIFYVREINYGCYGPYSSSKKIAIIGNPTVNISGPTQVCLGDTVTYQVGYLAETYYNWDAPSGVSILDEANSQTTVIFDSLGTYTLSNFSLNDCGGDSGSYTVKVVTLYNVNAGTDQSVCAGDTAAITAYTDPLNKLFEVKNDTSTQGRQGAMFNLIAHGDVVIDSFAAKFLTAPLTIAEIYGKQGSYRSFEQLPNSWSLLSSYYNFTPNPSNQFTVIPAQVNQPIASGDTFAFYVTTANATPVKMKYGAGIGIQQGVTYNSDGVLDFVQGTVNDYAFGAFSGPRVINLRIYYTTRAGLHFYWSSGDTTATIMVSPSQNTEYSVIVFDTSGCKNQDTLMVNIKPKPAVNAGLDTIVCKETNYQLQATTDGTSVEWQPTEGLNAYNITDPIFNYTDSVQYTLTATGSNGCTNTDTVLIRLHESALIDAGTDTATCPGVPYQIFINADSGSILWNPAIGLNDATSRAPIFSGNDAVEYIVSLTDINGCLVYDTLNISMAPCESYIKVPQAFTPNGDGTNDHFTLFGNFIGSYEIRIYNRWGEMVYSGNNLNDLNDLSRGWDGTYKGKVQDSGTFVYYVTAKDIAGKSIEQKGNLTLIR